MISRYDAASLERPDRHIIPTHGVGLCVEV